MGSSIFLLANAAKAGLVFGHRLLDRVLELAGQQLAPGPGRHEALAGLVNREDALNDRPLVVDLVGVRRQVVGGDRRRADLDDLKPETMSD